MQRLHPKMHKNHHGWILGSIDNSLLRLTSFLFIMLWLTSIHVFALPEDQHKMLTLSANHADINQETHRGEFIGHVILDQGSTHLRAVKAYTDTNQQNKLIAATAYGDSQQLVHYWTQPGLNKPIMHAYADIIHYYPDRHLIELIGHARVVQGDNSFAAAKITYDTLAQHVISQSDGNTRTVIIFHPEKKS